MFYLPPPLAFPMFIPHICLSNDLLWQFFCRHLTSTCSNLPNKIHNMFFSQHIHIKLYEVLKNVDILEWIKQQLYCTVAHSLRLYCRIFLRNCWLVVVQELIQCWLGGLVNGHHRNGCLPFRSIEILLQFWKLHLQLRNAVIFLFLESNLRTLH